MQRPGVQIRVNHQGGIFRKVNFGVELPKTRHELRAALPKKRPTYPREIEIREVADLYASQVAFRRRSKKLALEGKVGPIARFYNVYRQVVVRIRDYYGRDAIAIDIFLALKEMVEMARGHRVSVSRKELEDWAKEHIDRREAMIVKMAREGTLVMRPNAPRDARKRGSETYTAAAGQPIRGERVKDRITVRASLPDNPGAIFFITLGPATKLVNGRRTECDRRIMTVQTPEEWEAWKKTRIRGSKYRRDKGYRNRSSWRNDYGLN